VVDEHVPQLRSGIRVQRRAHANGGIKYLIQEDIAARRRGNRFFRVETTLEQEGDGYLEGANDLEFQIVDDADDEAKNPKRRSGAMYGLIPPTSPPVIRAGEFHQGRIVVNHGT
jgi:hypothetical protein